MPVKNRIEKLERSVARAEAEEFDLTVLSDGDLERLVYLLNNDDRSDEEDAEAERIAASCRRRRKGARFH